MNYSTAKPSMPTASNKVSGMPKPSVTKRLLPLVAIAVGIAAFFALGWDHYLSFEAIKENRQELLGWRDANQFMAVAAFMVIYAIATALSLPGGIWLTLIGGFLFGTLSATIYVTFAATIGATGIFLAARYAFADWFHAKAGPAVARMEDGFRENALNYLLVLRLVPLFPFWLVNLVPALLDVRLRTYVIATFVGIIPGTTVFASVGSGLGAVFDAGGTPDMGLIFEPQILLPILGLSALSIGPVLYKKWAHRAQ